MDLRLDGQGIIRAKFDRLVTAREIETVLKPIIE
jgi:hypothetical protein